MGTVRSQMVLNDGMSAVLRKISATLDLTLHSFEQVQRASGAAFDDSSISQARSALVGVNTEIDNMANAYREEVKAEERYNENAQKATEGTRATRREVDALNMGLQKTVRLATSVVAAIGLGSLVDISDQMASNTARLGLIVDDNGSISELESKIMASAQRSRSYYLDTAATVAKLGLTAGDAFSSNDEMIAFTELVNKNLAVGGASATEQAAAVYQLTQAMASGRLQGDEYRSIIENAPLLANAIEDYMRNVQQAEGSMKDWASEGLLTAQVIKNALFTSANEVEARFNELPLTWSQVWTMIGNIALQALSPLLQAINWVANNIEIIGPLIMGVVTALGLYYGALLAVNGVQAISNGLSVVSAAATAWKTGATLAEVATTEMATGAQIGYNAALLACPITWIVLGIIALIAVIYAVVAAFNDFAGTSHSVTGVVCGIFLTALAFIGNIFVGLWNTVVNVFTMIWNLIATVANFIATVFVDPVAAIGNLFYSLADTVLHVIQTLAGALDAVFGSNLAGAVSNFRASLGTQVESAIGAGVEIMPKLTGEALQLDRFEYGTAWSTGYDFGSNLEAGIGNMFGGGGASFDYSGYTLDDIAADTGSIADSAGGMADALEVSNELLSYIRDIAERDAINRFTTAEIKVDMTGMTNRIEGSSDVDGVIRQITVGFAEALVTAAEGVHS